MALKTVIEWTDPAVRLPEHNEMAIAMLRPLPAELAEHEDPRHCIIGWWDEPCAALVTGVFLVPTKDMLAWAPMPRREDMVAPVEESARAR
jgi:hypothetical protein